MCTVFLAALSTGLQMAGQYQQGQAQQAAYEAQARVAEQNKAITQAKREQESMAAAQQQKKLSAQYDKAEGRRRATMGALGISAGVGSGLDLAKASAEAYEQDSMNLLNNQRYNSWNNYITQVNYQNQADQSRRAGEQAMQNTYMNMFGTLLGGVGSIYGKGGLLDKSGSNTSFPSTGTYGNANYYYNQGSSYGWKYNPLINGGYTRG